MELAISIYYQNLQKEWTNTSGMILFQTAPQSLQQDQRQIHDAPLEYNIRSCSSSKTLGF